MSNRLTKREKSSKKISVTRGTIPEEGMYYVNERELGRLVIRHFNEVASDVIYRKSGIK